MEINKVYLSDCFEFFSKMPDKSVDHVFTSPPYNRKRNDKYSFYDDRIKDYYSFLDNLVKESIRVSKGNVFINIQKNYYNKQDVFKLIGNYSDLLTEIFIWEKSNPMPASGKNITNAYEFVLCFGKIQSNNTYTKNHLTTSVAKMLPEHKAMMHLKVAEFFIENFTKESELIFDPFMGMGTTAKVCNSKNRNWIGTEISENYYNASEKFIFN